MSLPPPSVPLLLSTRSPYALPPTRYLIPTSFTRFQLSQLINTSLSLSPPVPFDFLVRGSLLRGSLQSWMTAHGQGGEETLEVEYVQSVLPPRREASIPQEDWVSAVSLSLPDHILSGAYDNTVRIYTEGQELLHTLSSHSGPITAVTAFPTPAQYAIGEGNIILSSSQDRTVHMHHLPSPSLLPTSASAADAGPRLLTTLHTSPAQVSSVAPSPSGQHIVTATWDGLLGLFTSTLPTSHELPADDEPDISRKKRRKLAPTSSAEETEVFRKAPTLLLRGHTSKVSRAIWDPDGLSIFSAGWDYTVRQWDAQTGQQGGVKTTPDRVHLTIGRMAGPAPLLATGTSDRMVCMFDLRSSSSSTVQLTLPHASPVQSLVPHPTASHLLTTATLQGVLQIWDLRAPRESLVRVMREGGKCLCVDWRVRGAGLPSQAGEGGEEGVWVAGGEDRQVQVWRTVTGGGARVERVGKQVVDKVNEEDAET
ncbi:WD40 repeat-like protein [Calocera viscosa TUFC12733]|uniref:Ribosome biogenesis protein YTM1 n=1 Tax=Calocera viscosa (strain TUFC12733) TaxID=1330018 RepID=A0A167PX18_CALVF|nr:WD40 repeat-like protein [Calocera viscosa TUFC12733]